MSPNCKTCRFWKSTHKKTVVGYEAGECCFNPPVYNQESRNSMGENQGFMGGFPITLDFQFCGQHRLKDEWRAVELKDVSSSVNGSKGPS